MLVKKITLGLAQADKSYGHGSRQRDEFFRLINFTLENGVTRLDTAPNYKNSESYISKLNTKNLKISSKIPISEIKVSKLSSFIDFTLENILKKNKIENLENLLFMIL